MNSDKKQWVRSEVFRSAEPMHDPRLKAARKRLAESKDQEDAIEGVREIVANFLGSEEIGPLQIDRRTATFQVFWSFGIDLEEYDLLRGLGRGRPSARYARGMPCGIPGLANARRGLQGTSFCSYQCCRPNHRDTCNPAVCCHRRPPSTGRTWNCSSFFPTKPPSLCLAQTAMQSQGTRDPGSAYERDYAQNSIQPFCPRNS